MALPDTVTLNGNTGALPATTEGAVIYDLISIDAGGSVRAAAAVANTTPTTLKVSTVNVKGGKVKRQRHLIRLDATKAEVDLTLTGYSVYLVIDRPIGSSVTQDNIVAAVGRIGNFLNTTGYLTKVLNGEP